MWHVNCQESFKIISEYTLPMANKLTAFAPLIPIKHRPLVLLDDGGDSLRIFDISNFKPRPPPPFPLDDEGKLRTPEYPTTQREPPQNIHDDAEEQWEDFDGAPPIVYPREQLPWDLITNVPHWTFPKEDQTASTATGGPPAERSQFVFGGRLIVRISERGFMSLDRKSVV